MDLIFNTENWLDAQHSALGAALIAPEAAAKVMAGTTAEDYTGHCQTVYLAMRKVFLSGMAVDAVTVCAELGPEYRRYVMELMEITPSAASVDHYIALCRSQAQAMALRDLAESITQATTPDQMRALTDQVSRLCADRPSTKIISTRNALQSFQERHTRAPNYLTWPISQLDAVLYAEPGDLIIVGGAPSAGKTAFTLQGAWHWAKDRNVGFFSLETAPQKLFDRQIASALGIPMEHIKRNNLSPEMWERLRAASGEIADRTLDYISAAGMSTADIRALTIQRGYQIIIVDYLQLISEKGDNHTAQVTAISMALHTLAQSLGIIVVALSQLSRQGPAADQPSLAHLRGSGQLEQDADVVLLLSLADKRETDGPRILQIAKNKEGTRPSMMLAFDGRRQLFSYMPRSAYRG